MTVHEIYEAAQYILNKDQLGDAFTFDEFNIIIRSANIDYFKTKFGLPENYRPGMPLAVQGVGITAKMEDDLREFKTHRGDDQPGITVDSKGFGNLPTDYIHHTTIYTSNGDVEVVNDDEWSSRLHAKLKAPTSTNAICRFVGSRIQFAPKNIGQFKMTYIHMPATPFMDYNIANDEEVYLPAGDLHDGTNLAVSTPSRTVELEWPVDTHTDIVNLVVSMASHHLRSQLIQAAEKKKGGR